MRITLVKIAAYAIPVIIGASIAGGGGYATGAQFDNTVNNNTDRLALVEIAQIKKQLYPAWSNLFNANEDVIAIQPIDQTGLDGKVSLFYESPTDTQKQALRADATNLLIQSKKIIGGVLPKLTNYGQIQTQTTTLYDALPDTPTSQTDPAVVDADFQRIDDITRALDKESNYHFGRFDMAFIDARAKFAYQGIGTMFLGVLASIGASKLVSKKLKQEI